MPPIMKTIAAGDVHVGPSSPLTIIAGPCAAESRQLCFDLAGTLRDACAALGFGYVFKASFDKANRTSLAGARGAGMETALSWFAEVKTELGVPVTTDIHAPDQAAPAAAVVDILQIPAFLCRQTDLLVAAASTGAIVNVKKGQFLSPAEMVNVVAKLEGAATQGNVSFGGAMLTERGTFFGYNRLVNDFVGLGDMMEFGWPVCFDVTHSTQQPGGQGSSSGGRPERAPLLACAAVAAGVQALFIETHPDPPSAMSDAATMLPISETLELLPRLAALRDAMGG